jgi:WD40 repeat protein
MSVSLNCPSCMATFQAGDVKAGQNVVCPHCRGRFFVPPQVASPQPPPTPQAKASQRASGMAPVPPPLRTKPTAVRPPTKQPLQPIAPAPARRSSPRMLMGVAAAFAGFVLVGACGLPVVWWMRSSHDRDQPNRIAAAHTTESKRTRENTSARPKRKPNTTENAIPDDKDEASASRTTNKEPAKTHEDKTPTPKDAPKTTEDKTPTLKDAPKTTEDKTPRSTKPKESEAIGLIAPIDLSNLAKSDKLTFALPPLKVDEPPTPEIWDGHTNHIRGVSFNHDGTLVVSVSGDAGEVLVDGMRRPADFSIRVWDARRGKQIHKLEGFAAPLDGLSVSPGGRFAVFGHGGHYEGKKWVDPKNADVHLFDILTNREIPFGAELDGQQPAGQMGPVRPRFLGLTNSVFCTAFSHDLTKVLGACNHGNLCVWETKTGRTIATIKVPHTIGWRKGVDKAEFDPQGQFIILCADCKVWVFDAVSGRALATLASHKDRVWAVTASVVGSGKLIALSGGGSKDRLTADGFIDHFKDYAIRLWDVRECKLLKQFSGHTHKVLTLAFRPKTRHFLSGSDDSTVRLWDWESGKLLRTYTGHNSLVRSVAVAPDGRAAVSGGDDCVVRFWQLPALCDDLIAAVEKGDVSQLRKAIPDMDVMGPDLRTALAPLVKGLKHGNTDVARLAQQALLAFASMLEKGELPSLEKSDVKALADLLQATDNAALLVFAADGLAQMGPEAVEAVSALLKAADQQHETKVLAAALRALRKLDAKSPEALAMFERQIDHAAAEVNVPAALGLMKSAPERLDVKRLESLMARPNGDVRAVAEGLLRQKLATVPVKDLATLRQGLKHPVAAVRIVYLDAIAAFKEAGQEAVPDLVLLLGQADQDVALHAVRALKAMPKFAKPAIAALDKLVEDTKETKAGVEAAQFLCKIDPSNSPAASKRIHLVLEGLKVDDTNLKAFMDRPLENPSAMIILDLGAPAVDVLIKDILNRNNPKKAENQSVSSTALRYAAYVLLKELAKRAKDDDKLATTLQAHEDVLRVFWKPQESKLANQAKRTPGLAVEIVEVYVKTAHAAESAHLVVATLPLPKKGN